MQDTANNKINRVISIDPGLKGAIAVFDTWSDHNSCMCIYDMPTIKLLTKPAKYKFKFTNPKILVKSGKSIGERPKKLVSPAKYKTVMDWNKFQEILEREVDKTGTAIITEQQFSATGRSKTIFENFGKLQGIAQAVNYNTTPIIIRAQNWKEHYGLTNEDKDASIPVAKKLYREDLAEFELSNDEADAVLIGAYWIETNASRT